MSPELLQELPPLERLALTYAPRRSRSATLALLALDRRLGAGVAAASEPLIGQLKLAWWRDRLGEGKEAWPRGEPLLAQLAAWPGEASSLVALVDGWEAQLTAAPGVTALRDLAAGRSAAWLALAEGFGERGEEAIAKAAHRWTYAQFASTSDGAAAQRLAAAPHPGPLPRSVRSLAVLDGVSARSAGRAGRGLPNAASAVLYAMRLGIFGR